MATLSKALELASTGFHIFPLIQNSKLPAIDGWQRKATRDPKQIERWWLDPVLGFDQDYNIGISTSHYKDDLALLVVDVDKKGTKNGYDKIIELELEGHEFPTTHTQRTPTGGQHLVYLVRESVRQGVDVLGEGLDIRSSGGFIVGEGSSVPTGLYTADHNGIDEAPSWLVRRCGATREPARQSDAAVSVDINEDRATKRAIDYLLNWAPRAVEGEGGNHTTYKVALRVKDYGVNQAECLGLMMDEWNVKCDPPWSWDELASIVDNAYLYGKEAPGSAAPEMQFAPANLPDIDDTKNPLEEMNKQYAFVLAGGTGNILWETTDPQGGYTFQLLNKQTLMDRWASKRFPQGDKMIPLALAWMQWPDRRSYDGLVFEPGRDVGTRWYNMWRGFTVEPATSATHPMVERWKEHLLDNVCQGNAHLADWLTGWFAHLIQKPYEKPLVAVVFKGSKGTGKNALVERVSKLLGSHAMVTSRRRYLVSNFTMHLQKCLMFVLDEAFWSGDKEAEGVVKDLVTGSRHTIEPKGKESYDVRNLTRVVVIGNEEWLVPSTADERRWAVFEIGEGKKQDRNYFEEMRIGLDEKGGNAHLLRYLLDYKITQDVNGAPNTKALADQKHASLEPFEQWWLECLVDEKLVGSEFGKWPTECGTHRFRDAFYRYAKERNIRSRLPDERTIGHRIPHIAKSLHRKRKREDGALIWSYQFPTIEEARKDWERYIGHTIDW